MKFANESRSQRGAVKEAEAIKLDAGVPIVATSA